MSNLRRRLDDIIRGEWRVCLIGMGLSLCVFQTGYDNVATAGFQGMPGFLAQFGYKDPSNPLGYNLSTQVQTLLQSLMTLGSLFASLAVYLVGSRVSRRTAIWTACALSVVAVTLQIASTELVALYIGRLILGLSNGIFTPYLQMFVTEITPSFLLGSVLTANILVSNFGGLLAVVINNYTSKRLDKLSYQIPMAIIYVTPLWISIFMFFIPDTPRYYVFKGEHEKASKAIRRLRGPIDDDVLSQEIEQMRKAHATEQSLKGKVRFFDLFRGTDRRRTLLVYGTTFMQIFTGRSFLTQFSVYFLAQARIPNPFLWVMITYIISLSGNFVGSLLIRYTNRKTILIPGLIVMGVCMFIMAITNTVQGTNVSAGRVLVAMYIIHTWFGNAATTPSASCIASEMTPQRLRPEVSGTSAVVLWGLAWLVSYITPYFINPENLNWGPKYAYVWGVTCFLLAAYAWLILPETMGRSLEQLDEMFMKNVPGRKFRTFEVECENIDEKRDRRRRMATEDGIQSLNGIAQPVVVLKG